jgi:hypothetical protein
MPAPDRPRKTSVKDEEQPNIELLRLQFEREKWQAELDARKDDLALRQREQDNRNVEIDLKRKEQAASKWRSPLIVAIWAAAIAGIGNAAVTALNGSLQRDLESEKGTRERALEENKAESTRILEMIKTGNNDTAAKNIAFLLKTGLVAQTDRVARLQQFLDTRPPGTGPSLPTPARFVFEPGGSLTTQSFQADLQATLARYLEYLDRTGFPPRNKTVIIRVDNDLHGNTFYSDERDEILIGADVMTDMTGPLQQYGISVLFNLQHVTNEEILGLEFGLADYLTASFLQNPRIGEVFARVLNLPKPYLRTMDNERKFTEAKAGADHLETAEIWGGLFWELRQRITRERLDPILAKAWQATLPSVGSDTPSAFVKAVLASIPDDEVLRREIQDVLRKREFPAGK